MVRCYTISSAPEAPGYLEISVKRQGIASATLHELAREGIRLAIRGPGGHFLYPDRDPRPIVLLGGGVGATPLMSMLRHAAATEPERPVTLILSVRSDADVPFRAELEELPARHPNMRIVVAVTRGSDNPSFYPGRIDEKLAKSIIPAPAEALHFICGPAPMIQAMRSMLARMGVPDAQVFAEAFEAAVAWASGSAAAGAGDAARRSHARAPGGVVEFARSGGSAPAPADRTLLDAAEAAGIAIDFSCRSGICGTCRTRLVEGSVDAEGDALDAAERNEGWILPCVAFARGRCVIDA
jgi:ferredoxin-NADP reductase